MLLRNPLYTLKHLAFFAIVLILTGCSGVTEPPSTTEDAPSEIVPAETEEGRQEETSEIMPAEVQEEAQAEEE